MRTSHGFLGGIVLLCCAGGAAAGTDLSHSTAGTVADGSASIQYRLFEPAGVAPGEKAPLVLFLHGMGDRGTDNVAQTLRMGGLLDATRSGPHASYVLAPQLDTASWFQSFSGTPTDAMSLTVRALKQVIATGKVDASRIYVTGLSMGGMGTWDILAREPELFAAAVPMSGGGNTRDAAAIKDVPVWAFHGSADDLVPADATRDMIGALRDAGGSPRYSELAGAGHDIWDGLYEDASNTLYPWLFAQRRGGALAEFAPIDAAIVPAPQVVPEPGTLALVAVGGVALLSRRRPTRRA